MFGAIRTVAKTLTIAAIFTLAPAEFSDNGTFSQASAVARSGQRTLAEMDNRARARDQRIATLNNQLAQSRTQGQRSAQKWAQAEQTSRNRSTFQKANDYVNRSYQNAKRTAGQTWSQVNAISRARTVGNYLNSNMSQGIKTFRGQVNGISSSRSSSGSGDSLRPLTQYCRNCSSQ